MKEKFIEVIDAKSGKRVTVNINKITQIQEGDGESIGTEIHTTVKHIPAKESYQTVKQMLGIEPNVFYMIANDIINEKITEKQKKLLLKLSFIYNDLAKECANDENFDNYLANYTHLMPMALEDLAAGWKAVAGFEWARQRFNPEYIEVAVGKQNENNWFVQTTDKKSDTYLSEPIAGGLRSKEEAMKVAKEFAEKHKLDIAEWD